MSSLWILGSAWSVGADGRICFMWGFCLCVIMCLALLTICFTEFWYLSVGSCFSSVMLFCSMKFCTFLCMLSVGMIIVVLPLSAYEMYFIN